MHRDLNDIIPPSKRKMMNDMGQPPQPQAPMRPVMTDMNTVSRPKEQHEEVPPQEPTPKRRFSMPSAGRSFPFGTALLALVIIAACGLVFYSFAGAKVVIVPVTSPATVIADFVAYADKGDLTFKIIPVEKTATADIEASGITQVSEASHGTITISNAQSSKQALIKNTRFQSADGLVFRIHDSVSVPAGGELKVDVYADEPGDKYNIGPTTFTIPGLKGSTAFTQVTAKSVGSMTGGFVGQRATAPQEVKDKTYASMQADLTTMLQKELASKIPPGYVLIPGTSYPTYSTEPDQAKSATTVTLAQKGTLLAVVFPEDALARAVAFKSIGTYDGSAVTFESVDTLTVKPVESTLAPDAPTYAFSLSGTTNIVWQIDSEKMAGAIAGKNIKSAEIALKSFLEIDKAKLVLRPFWARSFPADPTKIHVVVTPKKSGE